MKGRFAGNQALDQRSALSFPPPFALYLLPSWDEAGTEALTLTTLMYSTASMRSGR